MDDYTGPDWRGWVDGWWDDVQQATRDYFGGVQGECSVGSSGTDCTIAFGEQRVLSWQVILGVAVLVWVLARR